MFIHDLLILMLSLAYNSLSAEIAVISNKSKNYRPLSVDNGLKHERSKKISERYRSLWH